MVAIVTAMGGLITSVDAYAGALPRTPSTPGVSTKTITVGYITSETGSNASTYGDSVEGLMARIDLQNAEGGVDGRKIKVDVIDDASTASNELPDVQALVQQDNVFGVMEASAEFGLAYQYLNQLEVPVVSGYETDGTEWANTSINNMFDGDGSGPATGASMGWEVELMHSLGVSKVAVLAYGISAASQHAAQSAAASLQGGGIDVGYENLSVPLPDTEASTIAVSIQNSGAQAVIPFMGASDDLGVLAALKAQGVDLKAPMLSSIYGQSDIATPTNRAAVQGAIVTFPFTPLAVNTTATKAFAHAVHKYTNYAGVPDIGVYFGWSTANLMIEGLTVAGKNPTRASFVTNLHKVKNYTAGGIQPTKVDFAIADQGTYGGQNNTCYYAVRIVKTTFPMLRTKPFCS
jgi:branched-chain amino acid transport system substrate-binding protein